MFRDQWLNVNQAPTLMRGASILEAVSSVGQIGNNTRDLQKIPGEKNGHTTKWLKCELKK